MAQTFKKSITKLDTVTSYDGKTDVVYNVGWYYIIQDDSNDTQDQLFYETELSIDSISSFTEYSSLTESDVIGWIEASLILSLIIIKVIFIYKLLLMVMI